MMLSKISKRHRSTDLTLYEVCELLDENHKRTGIFRLARKSLEEGLPFVTYCEHNHSTIQEAAGCAYFMADIRHSPVGDE